MTHQISTDKASILETTGFRKLSLLSSIGLAALLLGAGWPQHAGAEPLAFASPGMRPAAFEAIAPADGPAVAGPEVADDSAQLDERLRRQTVAYNGPEAPGTIVIDTPHTYLYLVQPGHTAIRYGIGVGRQGFTWAGTQTIARKSEWPDWYPPSDMVRRQPYLPRFVAGGPGNPLGARAMYLGNTEYRIHGTNDPTTIGKRVSSGCIRLTNSDVEDLYSRVGIGTKVVVLPMSSGAQPAVASHRRSTPVAARPARVSATAAAAATKVAANDGAVATARRAPQPFGLY
jgi:lipoprotein-anchoring transpeptidase ErfK/SrfK